MISDTCNDGLNVDLDNAASANLAKQSKKKLDAILKQHEKFQLNKQFAHAFELDCQSEISTFFISKHKEKHDYTFAERCVSSFITFIQNNPLLSAYSSISTASELEDKLGNFYYIPGMFSNLSKGFPVLRAINIPVEMPPEMPLQFARNNAKSFQNEKSTEAIRSVIQKFYSSKQGEPFINVLTQGKNYFDTPKATLFILYEVNNLFWFSLYPIDPITEVELLSANKVQLFNELEQVFSFVLSEPIINLLNTESIDYLSCLQSHLQSMRKVSEERAMYETDDISVNNYG
jgi:hypothetical protein